MVYGKKFFACFNHRFTPLQKQEIQKGLENGLNQKEVESYASSAYNYLQMREIRLALEHDRKKKNNGSLYEPSMDVEEMRKMRQRIEKGEKIRSFSVSRILMSVCLILMMVSSALVFFLTDQKAQPYLHLTTDRITVAQGASFDPMEYIADYSSSRGELILPADVSTSSPGTYAAVYVLHTGRTEITRILNVEVVPAEEK